MTRLVLQVVFAAVMLGALAGAGCLLVLPPVSMPPRAAAPNTVAPGFVGLRAFGSWRLICAAEPNVPSAPRTAPASRCRLNQEVAPKDQPGQVIVAANLSRVGLRRRPALTLRLPPTARMGDVVQLRVDGATQVRARVRGCTEEECFAAADFRTSNGQR